MALTSIGFAALAAWEESWALVAVGFLGAGVFGREYLKAAKPLTPRPFEHEWVRFLRQLPEDPEVRKLVSTEFYNVRTDEQHAELLAQKWYAE